MCYLKKFLKDESGPTAVEYAVMLGLILMTLIAGVAAVGQQTGIMYGDIRGEMEAHGIGP
jgi:pilus assembly protein Flp/PilA